MKEARDKGVFAMEAVWMRVHPLILKAKEMVARGDVVAVHADFSIELTFDPAHGLFDLSNGGGALLDLGVYPIHFARLFLGSPDTQQVLGTLSPTGSDAIAALQWGYASGATAQLRCATTASTPGRGTIAVLELIDLARVDLAVRYPAEVNSTGASLSQVLKASML